MKKLKAGDRVRLKVRMISGYNGMATVLHIDHDGPGALVEILKDGDTADEYGRSHCYCLRHELAKIRAEVPRP